MVDATSKITTPITVTKVELTFLISRSLSRKNSTSTVVTLENAIYTFGPMNLVSYETITVNTIN